ncbi:MAG TPA: hypothetical protein VN892_03140 [Solirubrobacteraceae bacterium]|nr:hypothetical protein [Solirubrobacteraceae bacterium]
MRDHAETKTLVAKKEADRHNRRPRELGDQQQKLVQLHYQQAVSIEVMQAEQQRIEAERSQAHRWSKAARSLMSKMYSRLSRSLSRWWMKAGCRMRPPTSSANG